MANPSAKLSLHCKTKLNACVVTMKMLLLLRLSILVLAGVASVGGDDADPPRLAAVADAEDVADRGAARHTHTLTGLRLSDVDASTSTSRGMGRRLLLPAQDGKNPGDDGYVSTLDVLDGVDSLQTEFFVAHGRNFTEEELNDALDDAYVRATENDGANLRFEFDEDLLLELERGRALKEYGGEKSIDVGDRVDPASTRRGRRLQSAIIRGGTGMLVTLQSPGFPGNPGRRSGIHGLFWCASLRETRRADIETPLDQRLTLKNCKTADIRQIEWTYTSDLELLVSRVGTFFHSFCARTKNGRQGSLREKIRMNQCGTNINNTQSWELNTNYQWISSADARLCVTTKRGQMGSGNLNLRTCVESEDVVEKFDAGQMFTLCRTEGQCAVGTSSFDRRLPLECDITQNCRPSG